MDLVTAILVAIILVVAGLAALGAGVDSRPGFGGDFQHRA